MFRLVIADDERIVRESISNLIDWTSIGIEVIGVCKNGMEAYDMILDDYPDIVLTDIRMPGLSGLDLIERLSNTDKDIEFVILSGYSEFEYAKKAMKHGVRHYLLKPCSEVQIIEVMQMVKADCFQKRSIKEENLKLSQSLKNNMMKNLFVECLSRQEDFSKIQKEYEAVLDFYRYRYDLFYIYYVEKKYLKWYMDNIRNYFRKLDANKSFYFIYVTNTLIIFFQSFDAGSDLGLYLQNLKKPNETAMSVECSKHAYDSFSSLFWDLLNKKIKRYEIIHLLFNDQDFLIYNHNALAMNLNGLTQKLADSTTENRKETLSELHNVIIQAKDVELTKALISNMIFNLYSLLHVPIDFMELNNSIIAAGSCKDIEILAAVALSTVSMLLNNVEKGRKKYKDFIEKTLQYIDENLSDTGLTLKKIAETYLYMNVDYLSKQFIKQTGVKFSQYLSNARMEKAKILLEGSTNDKIYVIAEQVGCGNNPQYFSQIFKKYMGITPTAYIKEFNKEEFE